jgi:hypothetical protein
MSRTVRRLCGAGTVAAMVALAVAVNPAIAGTHRVPRSIVPDCSEDVTGRLMGWIDSVPDRSVLTFRPGGCYRIDGTLVIEDRHRLEFRGRGARFQATTVGAVGRSQWRITGGSHIVLRNMRVRGASRTPGRFDDALQHQHAVDIAGAAHVTITSVRMARVTGDCVYVSRRSEPPHTWSRAIRVIRSSCRGTGRMGVAVVAARDVGVRRTRFSRIGRTVLDIEPPADGFGAARVTFADNTASGPLPGGFFSAIGDGPVEGVTIARNRLTGAGMYMAVVPAADERAANLRIVGNESDTGYRAPGSAAIDIERVDGVEIARNAIPLSGPNMALAAVLESCDVRVFANRVSRGGREARVAPFSCP